MKPLPGFMDLEGDVSLFGLVVVVQVPRNIGDKKKNPHQRDGRAQRSPMVGQRLQKQSDPG
jgi:hypothetical protein